DIDSVLRELEKREKEVTGLSSLKIGRNKIYGFYIEISKVQAQSAPLSYTRKQTLTNCERFITAELNELEKKVLVAQEKIKKIETSIYDEFVISLSPYLTRIKELSEVISEIDLACSLAQAAIRNSYTRPFFVERQEQIEIRDSRHPMVERTVDNFQKNDFVINEGKNFIIVTGPNMSGKSTYLRQIGLISIMAQIGSFVPAQKAFITIYDRIFTRIGAKDDVVSGKSTFLVEMLEMSGIINNSSRKSLILLDEVGRGTGTLDGIAVAWAISEYLFQAIGAVTIFATHYTELTIMSEIYECVANKRVRILESENGIVFLHKIEEGSSSSSYGIEVAKLAGFPAEITQRALEILEQLSDKADLENRLKRIKNIKRRKYRLDENQLKMF
ncbi:MAG TPA: DNA mismatch repair protein MutS, partial [Petrotogaceae bacterium]|nr:DNA mismatch repair protein MutS [Petrotogaceae bacterium]